MQNNVFRDPPLETSSHVKDLVKEQNTDYWKNQIKGQNNWEQDEDYSTLLQDKPATEWIFKKQNTIQNALFECKPLEGIYTQKTAVNSCAEQTLWIQTPQEALAHLLLDSVYYAQNRNWQKIKLQRFLIPNENDLLSLLKDKTSKLFLIDKNLIPKDYLYVFIFNKTVGTAIQKRWTNVSTGNYWIDLTK